MRPFDLHCDTLLEAFLQGYQDLYDMNTMSPPGKLEKGNYMAQCYAIFMPAVDTHVPDGVVIPSDEEYIAAAYRVLMNTIERHSDRFALVRSVAELDANAAAGKLSAILTMEDGRAVQGRMENLQRFYDMGVRMLGLTWNYANCFGQSNSADPALMALGLTGFGKEAVERMNEMGMAVDVSHLSDGGFWDVAAICKSNGKPFAASHSNSRTLSGHRRNLTDDMIRTVGECGGVAGLNYYPGFLNEDITCQDSTAALIARHARYMANLGGVESVALGSDFDGITGNLEVAGGDEMYKVFAALEKEGFTQSDIEKIAWRNARRFFGDTIG